MSVFDDRMAEAAAEYRARESEVLARTLERDAARYDRSEAYVDLATVQAELRLAQAVTDALEAELEECKNPTPPPPVLVPPPLGLHSGGLGPLLVREQSLGIDQGPTWDFAVASMGSPLSTGYGERILFPNIHSRVGGAQIKWARVANGEFDAQLTTTLKSIHANAPDADVYIVAQEEPDLLVEGPHHGTPDEWRGYANRIKFLAAAHCPNAKVGMALASADRLPTWMWLEADFYAFDPHVYGWPALTFRQRLDNALLRMRENGVEGRPFAMHVGVVENPADPNAKANWIRGLNATRLEMPTLAPNCFAITYWDKAQTVNGKWADERVDSSPASLAAFKEVFA